MGLAYSLQFVWAPLLDRVPALKMLGQRRGWMRCRKYSSRVGLFAMAFAGTRYGLVVLGVCALVVAFSSATQDIAIDAWRIEIAADADELGLLTSAIPAGLSRRHDLHRFADPGVARSIWAGRCPIHSAASGMAVGLTATLAGRRARSAPTKCWRAKEAEKPLWTVRGFFDAVAGPFIVFFKTHGALALVMLLAISFFRLPDFVRGPMINPFYHDIGSEQGS